MYSWCLPQKHLFYSILDSMSPVYIKTAGGNNTLRSSIKCVRQVSSPTQQQSIEPNLSIKTATKRQNDNSNGQQEESVKRARLSSRHTDDSSINSNRIVLRIRKTSEDLSSSRSETSNNNSNHQITIQIKEPLVTLREDNEDQNESQLTLNVFDIFNQTEQRSASSKTDNE